MKTHCPACAAAAICMGMILTSCGFKKEKISPVQPVRVEVTVAGDSAGSADAGNRTYSGTIEAASSSELSFNVGGTILELPVSEGQRVARGTLIGVVKAENLQDANSATQAELSEARDAYARLKKLHDANALPEIKWVEVQTRLKQAEKAAAISARTASDARIYAPYDGYIAEKYAGVGQTAAPGVPVMKIVGIGDVKASVSVPESEINAFRTGTRAEVKAEALGGAVYDGILTEKGVSANPLTRSYDVKYSISNADGALLPGMICTVSPAQSSADAAASGNRKEQVRTVLPPQAVLLSADNRNFVWVARHGKAARLFVKQSGMVPEGIVISSGLSAGDSVIISGMQKVSEGTPVTVISK